MAEPALIPESRRILLATERRVVAAICLYVQFMAGLLIGDIRVGTHICFSVSQTRDRRRTKRSVPQEVCAILLDIVLYTGMHAAFYAQIILWITLNHLAFVYIVAPMAAAFAG